MTKQRIIAFLVTVFLLVSGSFADTETLVIDAIIPRGSTSGDSPVHSLFVQDLFLQNQNLIANGEKIDIGQGSALFGNTPVPLFVVRHVTNSTEPMIISVEVSPFICTNTDGTTSVLSTNVQSQAGLDAYLSDIDSFFATVVDPNGNTERGTSWNQPETPSYSGKILRIVNDVNEVLYSDNSSNIIGKPEKSQTLNTTESRKIDKYKFHFETITGIKGSWSHNGWLTWTWTTDNLIYTPSSLVIPNEGFITEYVEYSVNITDESIPTDGMYVMNVKVKLSTDQ